MKPLPIFVLLILASTTAAAKDHPQKVTVHVKDSKIGTGDDNAIYVYVVMPDGSNAQLWCKPGPHYCWGLDQGDYQAEIKGNVVWIYTELPSENVKYNADGSLMPRKMRLGKIMYHVAAAQQRSADQ